MWSPSVIVAVCAAIGNGLQGWDNAAIAGNHVMLIISSYRLDHDHHDEIILCLRLSPSAGSLLYVTKEFRLSESPSVLGAIVSASLLGKVLLTVFTAGPKTLRSWHQ